MLFNFQFCETTFADLDNHTVGRRNKFIRVAGFLFVDLYTALLNHTLGFAAGLDQFTA